MPSLRTGIAIAVVLVTLISATAMVAGGCAFWRRRDDTPTGTLVSAPGEAMTASLPEYEPAEPAMLISAEVSHAAVCVME